MLRIAGASLSLVLILAAPAAGASGASPSQPEERINVCKIEFTEIARKARFDLLYSYRLTTNEEGSVVRVEDLPGERSATFVREDRFVPCLESWKLEANQEYVVEIRASCETSNNYISYSRPGGSKVTLLVGEWGWQRATE